MVVGDVIVQVVAAHLWFVPGAFTVRTRFKAYSLRDASGVGGVPPAISVKRRSRRVSWRDEMGHHVVTEWRTLS